MVTKCSFEIGRDHFSLSYFLLLLLILVPFGSWFGWFFWKQLSALPQETAVSPMTRLALKLYIAATTAYLYLAAVTYLLFPLLTVLRLHRLVLCAIVICASILSVGIAYVSLQRVLLEQLKVTFSNTTHAIGPTVAKLFDAIQLCFPLTLVGTAYGWTRPCFVAAHIYEMPGVKWNVSCRPQNRNLYTILMIVFGFVFICGNTCIVAMYVWRMKAVFLDANLTVADSMRQSPRGSHSQLSFHAKKNMVLAMDLMRKSTVIAIWSVGSTLLTIAAFTIPFQSLAFAIDLVLNEVLIYCLFPVGDGLYDTLLRFCHFTVDCYLPKRTLQIEKDFIKEMTEPRALQSLSAL